MNEASSRLASGGRKMTAAALYVITLLLVTRWVVAGPFRYYGYVERTVRLRDVLTATLLSILLVAFSPTRWRRPSESAFAFLVAIVGIPILWIPVFYGPLSSSRLATVQWTTVGAIGLARAVLRGARRPVHPLALPPVVFWGALSALAILAFGYVLASSGLHPHLASFTNVYDQRDAYSANVGSVGAYLVGWLSGGVLPFLLAAGLHRHSRPLAVGGVGGVVLLYSITGQKSYLIGVVLALVAYTLCRREAPAGTGWVFALTAAIWAAAAYDRLVGGLVGTSLFVRRAITTGGLNTAFYADYFAHSPKFELRHSIFSFLGAAPDPSSPAQVIGRVYYHSTTAFANANFIADGIANFGVPGALAGGLLLGLCLRGYDKISAHLPLSVTAPAMILILIAVANTALLTVLATHGGLALALVTLTAPRRTTGDQDVSLASSGVPDPLTAQRADRPPNGPPLASPPSPGELRQPVGHA